MNMMSSWYTEKDQRRSKANQITGRPSKKKQPFGYVLDDEIVLTGMYEWQKRQLEPFYISAHFISHCSTVRENGKRIHKEIVVCYAINKTGMEDILGIWCADTTNHANWSHLLDELKKRGVQDILFIHIDADRELAELIKTIFPNTEIKFCLIRLIHNSLKYMLKRQRNDFRRDLKKIYGAQRLKAAQNALAELIDEWGARFSLSTEHWVTYWQEIASYFKLPSQLRKSMYSLKAIDEIQRKLKGVAKKRSSFEVDSRLIIIYQALKKYMKRKLALDEWAGIKALLEATYKERFTKYEIK